MTCFHGEFGRVIFSDTVKDPAWDDDEWRVNFYTVNPLTGEIFIQGLDMQFFARPLRPVRRVIE